MGRNAEPTAALNCDVCGKPLPPRAGAGRPRKRHPQCAGPRHTATGEPKSPPPDAIAAYLPPARTGLGPEGLERRGAELWNAMFEQLPGPLHREVLLEACRLTDRLDRMHALLRGERRSWAALRIGDGIGEDTVEVTVVISSIVVEARNSASALKAIVAELRLAMREAGGQDDSDAPDPIAALLAEVEQVDELAARRAR